MADEQMIRDGHYNLAILIEHLKSIKHKNIVVFSADNRRNQRETKWLVRSYFDEKYSILAANDSLLQYKGLRIEFHSLLHDPFPRGINFDTLIYLLNHPPGDHMEKLIPVALTMEAKIFVKQDDEFIEFDKPMIKSAEKT